MVATEAILGCNSISSPFPVDRWPFFLFVLGPLWFQLVDLLAIDDLQ